MECIVGDPTAFRMTTATATKELRRWVQTQRCGSEQGGQAAPRASVHALAKETNGKSIEIGKKNDTDATIGRQR